MIEFYTSRDNLSKWTDMLESSDVQKFIMLLVETTRMDNSFSAKFSGLLRCGNPNTHEILKNSIHCIKINTEILEDLLEDLVPNPPPPSDLPPPSNRLLHKTI